MTITAEKLLTADEFSRRPEPEDGSKEELVRGVVITMPPPGFEHGLGQGRVYGLLDSYTRPRRLGRLVIETGLITERDPDSVRGPDVSYWSAARLPFDQRPRGYPDVAADLCVEVLSPSRRPADIAEKVREYLQAGVRLVWIIDPITQTLTVHRPQQPERVLTVNDTLSGEDVVPGFTCLVADLFE
jgi:Uma2 family endonuclease